MSPDAIELLGLAALDPERAEPLGRTLAGMDPWATLGYGPESLSRSLSAPHPDLTRWLALRDGRPLGVAAVRCPWLRGAYIELFAVLPQAQGQGVGGRLMEGIESAYRDRAANLWLLVSAFNGGARRFYARRGFAPIGTIPDLVVVGQDEILMRKVLKSHPGAARPGAKD